MKFINIFMVSAISAVFLCGANCAPEGSQADGFLLEPIDGVQAPQISPKKKFGIVITIFNRPEYVQKTFDSLKASNMYDTIVVIVDDASTDPAVLKLIEDFEIDKTTIIKLRNRENSGVLTGLMLGFKMLERNAEFLLNIDNDVNVKSNWLEVLATTYKTINDPNIILTGFNTSSHPTIGCHATYCAKKSIGGINFFMSANFFQSQFRSWFAGKNIRDNHTWKTWDWTVVGNMEQNGFHMYATTPSVVQHIGFVGLNAGAEHVDIAEDY